MRLKIVINVFLIQYSENFSRVSRKIQGKFEEKNINNFNKALYYYLNYCTCKGLNDEKEKEWQEKLKELNNSKTYLAKANILLSEEE